MITIILFGIWNGFSILWQQNVEGKAKEWSSKWHLVGRLCILAVLIDLLLFKHIDISIYLYMFAMFNLSWTVYNFIINAIRKYNGTNISIWHIGNGGFDGWLRKYLSIKQIWVSGLVLIIINILLNFI